VPVDAVLSYHLNGATCGVAKFNRQLADRLGVPLLPLGSATARPIVSVKFSEMSQHDVSAMKQWQRHVPYDLFLHDVPDEDASPLVTCAERAFAGNPAIAQAVRSSRPDVIEAFCPSTIQGNPHRSALNVLTFGMAHKLNAPYYEQLKALLDRAGCDYTVSVSSAIHEGSPWSEVAAAGERIRSIFGAKTCVLGYLADDALARELRDCTAVAMFFNPALRANNTTYWASVDAGRPVITNLDEYSPALTGTFDIDTLADFGQVFQYVRPSHDYTWERLLEIVQR